MDRGGVLRAVAPARRRHRGQDRGDRRRSREGAGAGRLSQLLVPRSASRTSAGPTCATITSSTISATCSRAPSPISWRPAGAGCSTSSSAMSSTCAQTFGPGPGQKRGYCGHQEIELALIRLYHLTGERKHLDLAAYFIDERGRQPHYFDAGGARARRGSEGLLGEELRIQPVAQAGARADQGRRPRGARHVHVFGDGRPRRRARATTASSAPARCCGTTSWPPRSTSPPASARPRPTKASPRTTTCPTTPPMPRPAPRSR